MLLVGLMQKRKARLLIPAVPCCRPKSDALSFEAYECVFCPSVKNLETMRTTCRRCRPPARPLAHEAKTRTPGLDLTPQLRAMAVPVTLGAAPVAFSRSRWARALPPLALSPCARGPLAARRSQTHITAKVGPIRQQAPGPRVVTAAAEPAR